MYYITWAVPVLDRLTESTLTDQLYVRINLFCESQLKSNESGCELQWECLLSDN